MRATLAAFDAAVEAQGVTLYPAGKVPASPAYPYVVRFASTPRPVSRTQNGKSGGRAWSIATMYVGNSDESAFWVAEKTEAGLLDRRLSIPGKDCSLVDRESGAPIRPDEDAEGAMVGTDVWTFTTTNSP